MILSSFTTFFLFSRGLLIFFILLHIYIFSPPNSNRVVFIEKVIESVSRTFVRDFLRLSPSLNQNSEMLWMVFKLGGSVPFSILQTQFKGAEENIENLITVDILKWKGNPGDSGSLLVFSDEFEQLLFRQDLEGINANAITEILIKNYYQKLAKKYDLESMTKPMCVVIASVIVSATPEKPAYLNTVLKVSEKYLAKEDAFERAKFLLEYYLYRYLGLIQLESSYAVNLSEKAKKLVRSNKELWEAYSGSQMKSTPPKQTEAKQ